MTDNDRTEITNTGRVRRRNENGYIIHPDRQVHDVGSGDLRSGWLLVFSAISGAFFAFILSIPVSDSRIWIPLSLILLMGVVFVWNGYRKRLHPTQRYSTKQRERGGEAEQERGILATDPIWRGRYLWGLLALVVVGANAVATGASFPNTIIAVGLAATVLQSALLFGNGTH